MFAENALNYAINVANKDYSPGLNISINNCTFSSNRGALSIDDYSFITSRLPINTNLLVSDSVFSNNWRNGFNWESGFGGSSILYARGVNISIYRSQFLNNSAEESGGAIATAHGRGSLAIYDCLFSNNSARTGDGGAIKLFRPDSLVLDNCIFKYNFAAKSGGAISSEVVSCYSCFFENNLAGMLGGAIHTSTANNDGDYHNHINFIVNSTFNLNEAGRDGGAVYCQKYPRMMDWLIISQSSSKSNSAARGGFLYLSECHVSMAYDTDITESQAEHGGAIYSQDSCIAVESSFIVPIPGTMQTGFRHQPTTVMLANNAAKKGGALFLVDSSVKVGFTSNLIFDHNLANRGGAIYVLDNKCQIQTNSSKCFSNFYNLYRNKTLVFQDNKASIGSMLYGGLLDRCFTEDSASMLGIDRLKQIVPYYQEAQPPISSDPVRVCLCFNGKPRCEVRELRVTKLRGQIFNAVTVAVDQVKSPIASSISAYYTKISTKLGKGERRQVVHQHCTKMLYHVYTDANSAALVLQPEGYCECSPFSTITIHLTVQNCTTGFEQFKDRCVCDRRLLSNVTCSIDTLSISRKGSSWLSYSEEHLKMHANCPLDYCLVSSDAISVTSPDEQCANHRSGVICGECQGNHSIALGSSQMFTLYLKIHFHLADSIVCCSRIGTSGPPPSLQHDHFLRNSEWAHILCQCCLHQWIDKSPKLLHPSDTLSLRSMAQPGLWSGDMFLSGHEHLPENVAAVCLPTLHLLTGGSNPCG